MLFKTSLKIIAAFLLVTLLTISFHLESKSYLLNHSLVSISLAASITSLAGMKLRGDIRIIKEKLEQTLINNWIIQNNLNGYGEPKDTQYSNGSPLKSHQSQYMYIVERFPNKPWFTGYKEVFSYINSMHRITNAMYIMGFALMVLSPIAVIALNINHHSSLFI